MRNFRLLAVGLLAASLAVSATAEAKKGDEVATEDAAEEKYQQIEMGNIKEFHPLWTDAQTLQNDVTQMETDMASVNTNFKTAVGVGEDAPVSKAFEDFKGQAADHLTLALDGGDIKVTPNPDMPENLKPGVEALQSGVETVKAIIAKAPALKDTSVALVEKAKGVPAQINPGILSSNGLKAKDLGKVKKTQTGNVKAVKATPDRIEGVLVEANTFLDGVKALKPS